MSRTENSDGTIEVTGEDALLSLTRGLGAS